MQKHVDTTILNVEVRFNVILQNNDFRHEKNFNNMIFQNQITGSTVTDLNVKI